MNLDELKQQVEELIRAGKRDQARTLLHPLKRQQVPRARATDLSNLARRSGMLTLAMHIMSPIIRPKVPLDQEATAEETAAYALVLLGLGAAIEALEILERADSSHPHVLLALAFTHINRWNYRSAISYLKKYLKLAEPTEYQQLIARVNLAASYVAIGNTQEGTPLLSEIQETTKSRGWHLLHKNSIELSAQLAIQEKDWDRAFELLDSVSQRSEQIFNLDDFFVRKWQIIATILKEGPQSSSLEKISELRKEAVARNHWETVRDCDYYRATSVRDSALSLHVFFGTPYPNYRDRIAGAVKDWLEIPESYVWNVAGAAGRTFDIRTGEELGGGAKLPPGKSLHKALQAMTSDFYRPFLIGSLHSAVFPGEHYNPVSSPRRVSFLIQRLREWFVENEIPLEINVSKEGYRLQSTEPYSFLLTQSAATSFESDSVQYSLMLDKLRKEKGTLPVSSSQIATLLGISVRSARYFVKWALERKSLLRSGTGRSTLYKLGPKLGR